jgi:YEATS domain-containing protein 4
MRIPHEVCARGVGVEWRVGLTANPALEHPPFEVSESGWGEFEIQIKIFFHPESNEKPLTLFHYLKLHPYNGDEAELELARQQRRPVMSYTYDELVFNEPTEAMYEILTSKGTARLPNKGKTKGREEFVAEAEAVELDRLGAGLKTVTEHIEKTREKLAAKEKEVAEMKKRLEELS